MKTHHPLCPLVVAVSLSMLLLAACGGPDADRSFAAAKGYLEKNEPAAAIVELKNTLQARPDFAEARYLIGKAYLDRDDPVAAGVELRKAADLKFDPEKVTPLLARAMVGTGEGRKLIELNASTALTTPEAVAEFKSQVALAHAGLGDRANAEAMIAEALRAKPDHPTALLLQARALAARGKLDEAAKVNDELLGRHPDQVDALTLKGDLLRIGGQDAAGAVAQYRKALTLAPGNLAANTALLNHLFESRDLPGVTKQLEVLQRLRPSHPQTIIFEARLAFAEGDIAKANDRVQRLVKIGPADPQVLQLSSAVALARNELQLAEQQLGKLIQAAPGNAAPRRLLARTYLRKGEPAKALAVLEPLMAAEKPDAEALSLAGAAQLMAGDVAAADATLSRAAKLKPSDVGIRTSLAAAQAIKGNVETGLAELDAIASQDAGTTADTVLIAAEIRRRNFAGALKAVDRLEKKQPGKAMPLMLRGRIHLTQEDLASARTAFEKALAAEPGNFGALDALAALDVRENRLDQARGRFEQALKTQPKNGRAMLGLAMLDERAGQPKDVVAAQLARAIAAKPDDLFLREQSVRFHLSRQDVRPALEVAQAAAAVAPKDPRALRLLASVQLLSGDSNQAVATMNKVVALVPGDPHALLDLAGYHAAGKSVSEAAEAARRAVSLAPDDADVVRSAIRIDLATGRPEDAVAKARALQARQPKAAIGWLLEGEAELTRKGWPAAERAFRTALQKQNVSTAAQGVHAALRASGDRAKADAFGTDWMKRNPRDAAFLSAVAEGALAEKRYEPAAAGFEAVLKIDADNAPALNNLAWVRAQLAQPGAVALAERAVKLRPNEATFLDTLATALAAEGNTPRALEMQKRAVALAPQAAGLRLNLARLLVLSGDKAAARAELESLAKMGERFGQQSEVRELQGKL